MVFVNSRNGNDLRTEGQRIRWVIEDKLGLTRAAFARSIGVARQQVSQWINQPDKPPGKMNRQKIADAGGVTAGWIQYGENVSRETETFAPDALQRILTGIVALSATDPGQLKIVVDVLMSPEVRPLWSKGKG